MDKSAYDYRFNNCLAVFQLYIQGSWTPSKDRQEKGGIKVHSVIHANEGVPSDVRFTSAATNDSFMLKPTNLGKGDRVAMDRAYIDYAKFEERTQRGVIYVTKMKKSLKYAIRKDTMYQTPEGLMEVTIQEMVFTKKETKNRQTSVITHKAGVITYVDEKKHRLISLLLMIWIRIRPRL